ncbi:MAG: hypothetical protein EXR58_00285 [Chloroflexi bacterium]|nr:hypothetical protein [Chloroflexota bacterium]
MVPTRLMRKLMTALMLATTVVLVACAPPPPAVSPRSPAAPGASVGPPKKAVVGVTADVSQLNKQLSGNQRGMEGIELMVNAGLGTWDDPSGGIQARLAEAVPSIENGLWKTSPDGTMETTWVIKNGAQWHDGTPFTSADLVFTATVDQDREIAMFHTAIYDAVDRVTAVDPRTVTVRWKQIYLDADQLFSTPATIPLPKHLLEAAYNGDKTGFIALPYWSSQFVGLGPYKLVDFERGSHMTLKANDQYILGRPKIDEITVRFVPDFNTFTANLMAGGIDVTLGTTVSLDQAQAVKAQRDVVVDFTLNGYWGVLYPQLISPSPAAVADLRFRQALLYGIDRQGLIDSFIPGLSKVAHSVLTPTNADYAKLEDQAVKYAYDPRQASQMLGTLGFTKSPDGSLRDAANAKLEVQIRTSNQDLAQKTTFAVANGWNNLGIAATPLVPAAAQSQDREFRFTYPAFTLSEGGSAAEITQIRQLVSAEVPSADNGFRGNNTARYANKDYDALIDRFNGSLAKPDRLAALGTIARYISENLPVMGLYYSGTVTVFDGKVRNVNGGARGNSTWNIHAWEKSA